MLSQIAFLLILLVLAYQDLRSRSIHLAPLFVYAALAVFFLWEHRFPAAQMPEQVINFAFLLIQYLILALYFSWRSGKRQWVVGSMIGWGDVVFILLSALWLSSFYFLITYLGGLVATLLITLLVRLRKPITEIPLVSGLAASQLIVLAWLWWF